MELNLMKSICYKLLETAKRALEQAIEQDKDAAMRYIEEQGCDQRNSHQTI